MNTWTQFTLIFENLSFETYMNLYNVHARGLNLCEPLYYKLNNVWFPNTEKNEIAKEKEKRTHKNEKDISVWISLFPICNIYT